MNDHAISAIGRYVRTDLQPRLTGLLATPVTLFGWEHAHRRDRRRLSRKRLQLGADLTAFCLPPLAALTVLWTTGPHTPAVLAISLTELAAVAVLATQIIRYADLTRPTATHRPHLEGEPKSDTSPRGACPQRADQPAHTHPTLNPAALWDHLAAALAWLDAANPRTDHEISMRILKITEEAGEVASAYIGMTGQNPRKGVTHTLHDLSGELCDVLITALVALATITGDTDTAQAALDRHLTERGPRLRALTRQQVIDGSGRKASSGGR
ncbi:MazG-like family protein [Nonomuraea sp. ZG12]|uniref:MazG-like family protein n=1 Tax=Nonomuraea sp. ZG12 TaxID=3452207 RepID=UPI003F8CEFA8